MTHAEMVREVAIRREQTVRATTRTLEIFFEILSDETWLRGRHVVPGLGAFRVKQRKARVIVDPQTGEPLPLAASSIVTCRVAKSWRRRQGVTTE